MSREEQRRVVVENVAVVDVSEGTLLPGRDIHLNRGRIEAVCPSGQRAAAVDARPIREAGSVAIPGLIDAHVHALGIYLEKLARPWDVLWFGRQMRRNLEALLLSGVTTVRDMGAPTRLVLNFARQSQAHEIAAPRMFVSGAMVCAQGGYPHFIPPQPALLNWIVGEIRFDVATPEEASRVVDKLARAGVGVIKTFWSSRQYDDRRSPLPLLSPRVVEALYGRARRYNLPLAVHCTWYDDLDSLLQLPFDTLEHLPIDRVVSDRQIARIVERRLPLTATLMTYGIVDHVAELASLLESSDAPLEPRPRAELRRAVQCLQQERMPSENFGLDVMLTGSSHVRQSLARLHQAGATVAVGTDSGGAITPCGQIAWELEDMARSGMAPADILRAATVNGARVLRRPDLGVIAEGACADIVLLEGNPLEDISAIRKVALVIKDGRPYHPHVQATGLTVPPRTGSLP